ncbi:MAG TPA: sulfurtransferase [Thermoanaerobaculia bacterium]|nr:sulfurtransferase [Thermoanaerobaculia bacterium]
MHPILRVEELTPDVVLLDARPRVAYDGGHLAGARNADVDVELSARDDPAYGGRHPLPPLERWLARLGAWGIEPSTRVVIYDDQQGANAAARAWWMLRRVGHENVAVLDGRWQDLPQTTDEPRIDPKPPYPATQWLRPTVTLEEVDALRLDPRWKVLDVRSAPRYRGETEPIDPIAGHIPGALNLPYFENLDGDRFKSPDALRAQYESLLGDTPPEHLVVHCGSGVTACHTLLALEAAGLTGAALYVGSWGEWCRRFVSDRSRV